jgi:hypothetical protein
MAAMKEAYIGALIFVITVAFAAGGYVAGQHFLRKQINGLGARVNRNREEMSSRLDRLVLALVHLSPDEKREEVIRTLLLGEKSQGET